MNRFLDAMYFDTMDNARKIYAKNLEPVCRQWDLTKCELDVLLFLHNNPEYDRAADIVQYRGIAKSHVSLSVKNLEEKGLLSRTFSPEDRRTAHLVLSEQAKSIAEESRELQLEFFQRIYTGISDEEFALWRSITKRVRDNINSMNE